MEKFDGKIGIKNLIGLVKSTAPFLFADTIEAPALTGRFIERGEHPMGWLSILRDAQRWKPNQINLAQKEDYFAFCVSCHHATVATFVPTDVDTKIRGHLWNENNQRDSLRRMFQFVRQVQRWDNSLVTARAAGFSYPLSGHNGEWLSVLAGALGAFLRIGDTEWAERAAQAIEDELLYEAKSFEETAQTKDAELELLKLSAHLTHNAGDLDQGMSYWKESPAHQAYKKRFGRLAHENDAVYGGSFHAAAHLYKRIMAPEGHRNYPLRQVRGLRTSADFLLPIAPFLDDWGAKLAAHPDFSDRDKSDLLAALLLGCKTIRGQLGYFRAYVGMTEVPGGRLARLLEFIPAELRPETKSTELKKHLNLSKSDFEGSLKKRAQDALQELGRGA